MNKKKIQLNPKQTVLVIGGKGFIGKHVVEQIENYGAYALTGSRCLTKQRDFDCRKITLHKLQTEEQYNLMLEGIDVVINTVGILRERVGESYDAIHHQAVKKLAEQCGKRNIRYVHISALGIFNPVKSQFSTSKVKGEAAIQKTNADWYIIRPSLVDGVTGYGAKWFRKVAKWPIHIAPANALGKLAPIDVSDLGEIIAKIALMTEVPKHNNERIFEIGGKEFAGIFEYLDALSPKPRKFKFRVPTWIARTAAHLFDLLHLTPYSFGHYEILQFDNCPKNNHASEILGREPNRIGYIASINKKRIKQYREDTNLQPNLHNNVAITHEQ